MWCYIWRKEYIAEPPLPTQLTFNKKSQGESEAVNTNWNYFWSSTGNQCYSRDPEKQIHCTVLPVHQLDPWFIFCVIEAGMWPINHKLFNHNTCDRTMSDKWDKARTHLDLIMEMTENNTYQQMQQRFWALPQYTPFFLRKGAKSVFL